METITQGLLEAEIVRLKEVVSLKEKEIAELKQSLKDANRQTIGLYGYGALPGGMLGQNIGIQNMLNQSSALGCQPVPIDKQKLDELNRVRRAVEDTRVHAFLIALIVTVATLALIVGLYWR